MPCQPSSSPIPFIGCCPTLPPGVYITAIVSSIIERYGFVQYRVADIPGLIGEVQPCKQYRTTTLNLSLYRNAFSTFELEATATVVYQCAYLNGLVTTLSDTRNAAWNAAIAPTVGQNPVFIETIGAFPPLVQTQTTRQSRQLGGVPAKYLLTSYTVSDEVAEFTPAGDAEVLAEPFVENREVQFDWRTGSAVRQEALISSAGAVFGASSGYTIGAGLGGGGGPLGVNRIAYQVIKARQRASYRACVGSGSVAGGISGPTTCVPHNDPVGNGQVGVTVLPSGVAFNCDDRVRLNFSNIWWEGAVGVQNPRDPACCDF